MRQRPTTACARDSIQQLGAVYEQRSKQRQKSSSECAYICADHQQLRGADQLENHGESPFQGHGKLENKNGRYLCVTKRISSAIDQDIENRASRSLSRT